MTGAPRVAVTMTQCWHRVPGGVASSVAGLVDALVADGSIEPVAVGPRSSRPPSPWAPSIPTRSLALPIPVLYDAWNLTGRPSIESASGSVDVVHTTIPIVPRAGRTPVVATVHDLLPLSSPHDFTGRGARLMRRGLERIRLGASIVAVPSEVVAQDCRDHGFDPARLAVVPWGVDLPAVHDAPIEEAELARVRRAHGLVGSYVLFVGTIEPRKGLPTLLEAMGLLDRPEVTLAIAGPDGWGGELEHELAVTASPVARLGFVPEADLTALRRGAAVCCAPSRAEGFGLPVLEAMAAGAAVVTTAATAMAEVAGDAAVLVPSDDPVALAAAIGAVLDDPARARSLRASARERAGAFSWQRCASQMIEVYQRAIEHPR